MLPQNLLSCFVFNYNRAHYLGKCLESILTQKTNYKFEIILIDDCSIDHSKQVFEEIKNKYAATNLHFFSTNKNTGLGKRAALKLRPQIQPFLKSKYIYRIDSDDYLIDERKFDKQISFLEKNLNCVGICHHFKVVNEIENSTKVHSDAIVGVLSVKQILEYTANKTPTYNHTSTYLYRNVYQSLNPPQFNLPGIYGDVLYNFCMIEHGDVCFTDEVMSVYRIHEKGFWSSLSIIEKILINNFLLFKIFLVLSMKHKVYFLFFKSKYLTQEILFVFYRLALRIFKKIKKIYG